ncbi:MAG: hypothetical protein ACO2PO_02795 [Candidatus Calescibacterium sp.]
MLKRELYSYVMKPESFKYTLKIILSFIFTFLFISNNLNCSKENKKSILEETISKISYSIPTVAYFIRNLQEDIIEYIISAEKVECIKKESNKKIYDKCKLQDSLLMEGQIEIQPQISKYIINLKVSSISPPQINAELSGEISLKGGRFVFENISLHIRKEDGLPQDFSLYLSNISSIKFSGGYALRNEQEKVGKINMEFGDKIKLDLQNFEYAHYQKENTNTIDITIKGEITSYSGCIEKSTYNVDIRTKSEIRESGGEFQIITPVCPTEIIGKIDSTNIEIKKDICSIPQNICKFLQ